MTGASARHRVDPDVLGGLALIGATLAALIIANSPAHGAYEAALHATVGPGFAEWSFQQSIGHWINDGLMAVFFLGVGLEIKREFRVGHLASRQAATLPILAAIGGMAVPAALFWAVNRANPDDLAGWAVPSATDIAFAVGILALFGQRLPPALRTFLVALAIIDDLGAIIIIAIFYAGDLSASALGGAALVVAALVALNRAGVTRLAPYLVLGALLWAIVLRSGIHATLAGVVVALTIPIAGERGEAPLERLEHGLKPWIGFAIMPLFAFANAGLDLTGLSPSDLGGGVALGSAAGLFLGKQIGVFGTSWAAIRLGLAHWPRDARPVQLYGVSILCGIGFTMSLFIGGLAFDDPARGDLVRLGVLAGSALSALAGSLVLALSLAPRAR